MAEKGYIFCRNTQRLKGDSVSFVHYLPALCFLFGIAVILDFIFQDDVSAEGWFLLLS
jgi:hypothetical protein